MIDFKVNNIKENIFNSEDNKINIVEEMPSLESFSIYNQPRHICISLGAGPLCYS